MSLITPDFGLLVWMTLIFGIVFFVRAKWGVPMITNMVDERSKRINDSIAKAKEAEESLKQLAQRQQQLIDDSRREQARILKEAAGERDAMIEAAKEQARDEAGKILAEARTQIAAEKESALREIRTTVAELSVNVAEKVLREDLSSDRAQMALVEKLVSEIGDNNLTAN